MSKMEERIALARSETERICNYFESLSAEEWKVQSACDAWKNDEVTAHMCIAAEMFATTIQRGIDGDSSPPEGMSPPSVEGLTARLAGNVQRTLDMRQSLGDELLPTFASRCRRVDELLATLRPEDWDKLCYHTANIISVGSFVDLRIAEMAMHEWDIRSRMETDAEMPPETLSAIFDLLSNFIVGRLYRPGRSIMETTVFRFNVTGAVEGSYDITVSGGEAKLGPAGPSPAAVTFGCDAHTFALLVYGRLGIEEGVADRRITAEGDRELVAKFAA
jgi:uncharacterized protein (TIGR03083 family)